MKFVDTTGMPKVGGNSIKSRDESARFCIMEVDSNRMRWTDRKPRRDSKYWGFGFVVWDNENNCKASKEVA